MLWDPTFSRDISSILINVHLNIRMKNNFSHNSQLNHVKKKLHVWFIEKFICIFVYIFHFFLGKSNQKYKYYCLWMEKSGYNQFFGPKIWSSHWESFSSRLKRDILRRKMARVMTEKWQKNLCHLGNCNVENVDKDHKSSFTLCICSTLCYGLTC